MDDAPITDDRRIGRRQLLGRAGGAAAALAVGLGTGSRIVAGDATAAGAAVAQDGDEEVALALDRIQGNVVAGFRQHLQALVLVTVPDAGAGRRLKLVTALASYGIWLIVAGFIIFAIFRLATSYFNALGNVGV